MSSSYTSNLRLVLPVQGELSGTWGDTVNAGLTNLTDSSIAGYSTVSITSANQALTVVNGGADQARSAFIKLTTTTTANFAVYAPPVTKGYVVYNSTAYTATVYNSTVSGNTTAAGTGVAIPAGKTVAIYSDGTNFLSKSDYIPSLQAGAINNTPIGSTTPSTGAFTTLSASGVINQGGAGGTNNLNLLGTTTAGIDLYNGAGIKRGVIQAGSSSVDINGLTSNPINLQVDSVTKAQVSSTGLAVTGISVAKNTATYANNPAYQLQATDATTTTKFLGLGYAVDADVGVIQAINNGVAYKDLVLQPNGGNVGVGVAPSAWDAAYRAFQNGYAVLNTAADNRCSLGQNYYVNGGAAKYIVTAAATQYMQVSGEHRWLTALSGTAGDAIAFTEGLSLNASQILALGATGTSSTTRKIRLWPNTAGYSVFNIYNNNSASGSGLVFSVGGSDTNSGNTDLMTLDAGGNFLVGKATTGITLVGGYLNPQGGWFCSGANSTNFYHAYDTDNSIYRFYVSGGGQIYATNTSIVALSDQTLKENIRDLETGIAEVMALRPRRFDWKNGDSTNVAGFIAQELETVLPDLVFESKYNETETKKSIKMGDILPTLVKAIQEQQAQIESQDLRIAQLEADKAQLLQVLASVDNRLAALEAK